MMMPAAKRAELELVYLQLVHLVNRDQLELVQLR